MKGREKNIGVIGSSTVKTASDIENTQWVKYKDPKGGHGFAAEDANALNDQLNGKNVEKVGLNNELNGADRIVDGKLIQSKYYSSSKESVNSAFDQTNGNYKYGKQILEVPKDQFEDALVIMKKKISEGKVPGYTDPEKAFEIIKPGEITFKQSLNIAKAGNIDSLWFDVKANAVVSGCAFGISFIITYATGAWQGLSQKKAIKIAFGSAVRTGTIVMISGVVSKQLLRTSIGRTFATFTIKISREIITNIYSTKAGKELIEKIASATMKKSLNGAAAKNVLSKLLRSNLVTSTVTGIVLTIPDVYQTIISKNISWTQFGKNLAVNVGGIGGTIVGASVGASIGSIFLVPGTVIGGFIGSIVGGIGSAISVKKVSDSIVKDDAQIMIESLNTAVGELAFEYMLTEKELIFNVIPKIKDTVDQKWLKEMFKFSGGRENITKQNEFVRKKFESIFEEVLKNRSEIKTPKIKTLKWFSFTLKMRILLDYLFLKFSEIFLKKMNIII